MSIIRTLPPEIRVIIERHHSDRLTRSYPRPMLGEYAPWMIADLFGVSDVTAVTRVSTGWLQICWGILLLDDVIDDETDGPSAALLIASHLLVQRGVCDLLTRANDPAFMRASIDNAFLCNANAALAEQLRHRGTLNAYDDGDIINLGDKLALINICIDAVSDQVVADERNRLALYPYFKHLIAGLQLLDDLTDCRDDLLRGNMSLPLTIASQNDSHFLRDFQAGGVPDVLTMLRELVAARALDRTLADAKRLLARALHDLEIMGTATSRSGVYINSLLTAIDAALTAVSHVRILINDAPRAPGRWRPLANDDPARAALEHLRRTLIVVATSS